MREKRLLKIIAFVLSFSLIFEQSGFAQVAGQMDLSGHMFSLHNSLAKDTFRPIHLRYLDYDSQRNNFRLLLDKGDAKNLKNNFVQDSTRKLMEYFFVGLALPNDSFWVNLRPDSPDNVIDPFLAQTDLGKVLLDADLQLKKDTARMTSPETPEGREYWDKLYKKAEELLGQGDINIPTLTRPWIVPGEIIMRETPTNAYIYKATLKVMLEQDYLKDSAAYKFNDPKLKILNEYASGLVRELIIPKLTKELNSSKRYAPLRQVYYSLILAQWFKQRFKEQAPERGANLRMNSKNLTNLTSVEPWSKDKYFQEYQKSFKGGEYNIKEPVRTAQGQRIRSYFSGGISFSGVIPKLPGFEKTAGTKRTETGDFMLLSTGTNKEQLLQADKNIIAVQLDAENITITKQPVFDKPFQGTVSIGRSVRAESGISASSPLSRLNKVILPLTLLALFNAPVIFGQAGNDFRVPVRNTQMRQAQDDLRQDGFKTVTPEAIENKTSIKLNGLLENSNGKVLLSDAAFRDYLGLKENSISPNDFSTFSRLIMVETTSLLFEIDPGMQSFIDAAWVDLLAKDIELSRDIDGSYDLTAVFQKASRLAQEKLKEYQEFISKAMINNPQVSYLNREFPSIRFLDPENVLADTNLVRLKDVLSRLPPGHIEKIGEILFVPGTNHAVVVSGRIIIAPEASADSGNFYKKYIEPMGISREDLWTFMLLHEIGHRVSKDLLKGQKQTDWLSLAKEAGITDRKIADELFANDYAYLLLKGSATKWFNHMWFQRDGGLDVSKNAARRAGFFGQHIGIAEAVVYPGEDYFKGVMNELGVKDIKVVTDSLEWEGILKRYNKNADDAGFYGYDSLLVGPALFLRSHPEYADDAVFLQEAFAHETVHLLHTASNVGYGMRRVESDYLVLRKSYIENSQNRQAAEKSFASFEAIFNNSLMLASGEFYAWFYGQWVTGQIGQIGLRSKSGKGQAIEKFVKEFNSTMTTQTQELLTQHYQNLGLIDDGTSYDREAVGKMLGRAGDLYFKDKDYTQAIQLWQEALEKAGKRLNEVDIAGVNIYIVKAYFLSGNYSQFIKQSPVVIDQIYTNKYFQNDLKALKAMQLVAKIISGQIKIDENSVEDFRKKYKDDSFLGPFVTGEDRWDFKYIEIVESLQKWAGYPRMMELLHKGQSRNAEQNNASGNKPGASSPIAPIRSSLSEYLQGFTGHIYKAPHPYYVRGKFQYAKELVNHLRDIGEEFGIAGPVGDSEEDIAKYHKAFLKNMWEFILGSPDFDQAKKEFAADKLAELIKEDLDGDSVIPDSFKQKISKDSSMDFWEFVKGNPNFSEEYKELAEANLKELTAKPIDKTAELNGEETFSQLRSTISLLLEAPGTSLETVDKGRKFEIGEIISSSNEKITLLYLGEGKFSAQGQTELQFLVLDRQSKAKSILLNLAQNEWEDMAQGMGLKILVQDPFNYTALAVDLTAPSAASTLFIPRPIQGILSKTNHKFNRDKITGSGIEGYLKKTEKPFTFLETAKLAKEDFPDGYSTLLGLRNPQNPGNIPSRLKDIDTADVILPDVDIFLVNNFYNGWDSVYRLGFLEDGRPVAVRTDMSMENASLETRNSHLVSAYTDGLKVYRLGFGPQVHGIFRDKDKALGIVTDIVPGDFPNEVPEFITSQTVKELIDIYLRLAGAGLALDGDFQYFVTPLGDVQAINQGGIIIEADKERRSTQGWKLFIGQLIELLMSAKGNTKEEAFRLILNEFPGIFQEMEDLLNDIFTRNQNELNRSKEISLPGNELKSLRLSQENATNLINIIEKINKEGSSGAASSSISSASSPAGNVNRASADKLNFALSSTIDKSASPQAIAQKIWDYFVESAKQEAIIFSPQENLKLEEFDKNDSQSAWLELLINDKNEKLAVVKLQKVPNGVAIGNIQVFDKDRGHGYGQTLIEKLLGKYGTIYTGTEKYAREGRDTITYDAIKMLARMDATGKYNIETTNILTKTVGKNDVLGPNLPFYHKRITVKQPELKAKFTEKAVISSPATEIKVEKELAGIDFRALPKAGTTEYLNSIRSAFWTPGTRIRLKTPFKNQIGSPYQSWRQESSIFSDGMIVESNNVFRVVLEDTNNLEINGKEIAFNPDDVIYLYDVKPLVRKKADGREVFVLYRVWQHIKEADRFAPDLLRSGMYSSGLSMAIEEAGGSVDKVNFHRLNKYEALQETWEGESPEPPLMPFSTEPTLAINTVKNSDDFVIAEVEVPVDKVIYSSKSSQEALKSASLDKDPPHENDPLFYVPDSYMNHENEWTSLFAHIPSSFISRVFTATGIFKQGDDESVLNSPLLQSRDSKSGGIDFRVLPIARQPAATAVSLNLKALPTVSRGDFRPDAEWLQIQKMLDAGIVPSAGRIKEYLQNCCVRDDFDLQIDKVLNSVADILRIEEEQVSPTEPAFKEILVVLESGRSAVQIRPMLNNIAALATEPKLIAR